MTSFSLQAGTDEPARARLPLPPGTFFGFIAAVAGIVAMALVSMHMLRESADAVDLVEQRHKVAIEVRNVLGAIKDAETGQRGFLLSGNAEHLDVYRQGVATLPGALERLRGLVADHPGQSQRVDALQRTAGARMGEIDEVLDLFNRGRREDALGRVGNNRGKLKMDQARETIADIQQAEATHLAERQAELKHRQRLAMAITVVGSVLLCLLVFAAAFTASRDFRARERETWLRRSLADLAAALQQAVDPAGVASAAVSFLARRARAAVGAIYVRHLDGGPQFLRMGGYALPEGAPSAITEGHGLPGQSALERRFTVVNGLDAAHLPVTSAVGRSQPRSVVCCPATFEDNAEAVLELGFAGRAPTDVLELLQRSDYMLGLALRNAAERERTRRLLAQTRSQAEELQAQQEELRVSNEELQSQTAALHQSQAALEAQQQALGATNRELELRGHALESERRALLETQRALESASRYKTEFLANMSHELRTPLNSSLILAKLLGDNPQGNLTAEQVKFAQAILASNNDLLTLINDILDLSKIEAGKVDFVVEPVVLAAMLPRLADTFDPMARQKGLRFDMHLDDGVPTQLVADEHRVMQILRNLIANAVKFTERGAVTLRIAPAGAGHIAFEVQDTGIGIAADQQAMIFEAFKQADGGTSRRFGGTGLGLTISRELAQRMGGDIHVESAPGQGSRFTLRLPVDIRTSLSAHGASLTTPPAAHPAKRLPSARPPADAGAAVPPPTAGVTDDRASLRHPGRMILVVEDDPSFATALVSLAHERDFDCVVATSAGEAMRLAGELRPSGILLDVGLPDDSGLSVLERLKRSPATRHVPVHMVTASDVVQTARELGAVGYVLKPASREALMQVISDIERLQQGRLRRLLLVEDDEGLRESLTRMLATPDLEIVGASSVADALTQLGTRTFDCMVTDLSLPDGTGYDLLEKMAARDELGFPPVIVYTGRALTRDEEQRLRRYSNAIIIKGARSPERLLDEVTLFLHSVEDALPEAQRQLLLQARRRDAVLDGRTLLVAEDDVRNIFALSSVFEPLGVKLAIARNGREALQRMEGGDVDLVLMDVMMPEMDGLTAMRRIREHPDWRDVPIIALTAKAMPDDRQACIDAGANDYVAKPIDVDRLVSLCRVWCPK